MANFFDQFDGPAATNAAQPKNYFDQFDPAPAPDAQAPASFDDRFNAVSDEAAFRAVEPAKKEFGLADTWPARVAKSIYGAVTLPGDVVAGKVDPRSDEAIGRSFDLAGVVSPTTAAGAVLPKVAASTPKAHSAPTVQDLKAAASKGFESPEVSGLAIKPKPITDYAASVQTKLNEAGIDENLAPEVFGVLAKLQKVPENGFVTGKNIQSLRRMFGNAATSPDATKRKAAAVAMDELDGFLPNVAKQDIISGDLPAAVQTLQTARANYAAAKQAENIDQKTIQAELRAAAANSGQNVANTVRQRMADILLKPKERRGYSGDELAMMEQIVRGSRGGNALRTAGNVLGGGGGLGAIASATAGGYATGGPGAVAPLVGYALKSLSNKLTLKQADKLSEAIRSRAPLASSIAEI